MKNIIRQTTEFAHQMIRGYLEPAVRDSGDDAPCGSHEHPLVAVDATCGGGHDTLFLAQQLWPNSADRGSHRLLAFDVQTGAIDRTRERLMAAGYTQNLECGAIQLIQDSHETMANYLGNCSANVIVFNLGYLPGGDKSITTNPDTTLRAVSAALDHLAPNGLLCITMYSGHPAGAKEKAQLLAFAKELDASAYHVSYMNLLNQPKNPPELLLITKK